MIAGQNLRNVLSRKFNTTFGWRNIGCLLKLTTRRRLFSFTLPIGRGRCFDNPLQHWNKLSLFSFCNCVIYELFCDRFRLINRTSYTITSTNILDIILFRCFTTKARYTCLIVIQVLSLYIFLNSTISFFYYYSNYTKT